MLLRKAQIIILDKMIPGRMRRLLYLLKPLLHLFVRTRIVIWSLHLTFVDGAQPWLFQLLVWIANRRIVVFAVEVELCINFYLKTRLNRSEATDHLWIDTLFAHTPVSKLRLRVLILRHCKEQLLRLRHLSIVIYVGLHKYLIVC